MELRAATVDDADAIAGVWHRGWADGHEGNVPDGLYAHRQADHFRALVESRLPRTTVAIVEGQIVGFVTVHEHEIEEMYVDAVARGSGVAAALMSHGEGVIAEHHEGAWLAVVPGNARARRFYEKCGWVDGGPLDYTSETSDGPFVVPVRRYEKRVG